MSDELYKAWRPVSFKEVHGQDAAVAQLKGLLAGPGLPHAVMFSGATPGCGKTTLARICADKLKVHPTWGLSEVNAAEARGIDDVRAIDDKMKSKSADGGPRAFIIDECHCLTKDAQSALLKMLEDTPKWVYFLLCTTDPKKVLPTVRSRCTQVELQPLTPVVLRGIFADVLGPDKAARDMPSEAVVAAICEAAGGSARRALVWLHQVLALEREEDRLACVKRDETDRQAFDLVKALLWEGAKWPDVVPLLKALREQKVELEPLRQAMLTCSGAELLKGEKKAGWANLVIEEFARPFHDSGYSGLMSAVYNVLRLREKR